MRATNPLLMAARAQIGVDENDILYEPLRAQQTVCIGNYAGGSLDRVKQLVRIVPEDPQYDSHKTFVEALKFEEPTDSVWHESARWIKFKEQAEKEGDRWSKPHVGTLSLQALLQVKNCLRRGAVFLDHHALNLPDVIDAVVKHWQHDGGLAQNDFSAVRGAFLARKRHLIVHHRAEELGHHVKEHFLPKSLSRSDMKRTNSSSRISLDVDKNNKGSQRKLSDVSIGTDASGFLRPQSSSISRSPSGSNLAGIHMLKKLPEGTEGVVILSARLSRLTKSVSAFVRLTEAQFMDELLEVEVPVRFIIIIAAPLNDIEAYDVDDVTDAFGTLLTDDIYSIVAYRAKEVADLWNAVDEFLVHTVILPPGKFDPEQKLEPPEKPLEPLPRAGKGPRRHKSSSVNAINLEVHGVPDGLLRTGKLFGGLRDDLRRKLPWYLSDFKDGLVPSNLVQCTATSIFLYFGLLTNLVTFGSVMSKDLNGEMAVLETLVSGLICGVGFALFSGQPLNILSATGPVLVFEKILYELCHNNEWDFLSGRFWVGLWTAVILLIVVATDLAALVAMVTRFTEECFATLIGVLFIVQAFESLLDIGNEYPLTKDPGEVINGTCVCVTHSGSGVNVTWDPDTGQQIDDFVADCGNGTAIGELCNFKPDIFMFSALLFFGTFLLILALRELRNSRFFPTAVRNIITNFSSFLAIIIMTAINLIVGLDMPKLNVPTQFKPTIKRNWVISPFSGNNPFWLPFAAFIPALLFSILVFMDQQITAVIVNRKDHKLEKGFGYHLDLFILCVLIIICSLLGIPFFVAATVLSITHVQSLRVESSTAAPGEKPQFLGTREQRVTAAISSVLVGLSLLMADAISLIPTPVLYGVFLFMGYASLNAQLVDRMLLLLIPPKYQPDYHYLRVVPLFRVHMFTIIQIVGLILLYIIKSVYATKMFFPLMLIVIVGLRKALNVIYSEKELHAVDHHMPTWSELNDGRPSACCGRARRRPAPPQTTENDIENTERRQHHIPSISVDVHPVFTLSDE